MVIVEEKKKVSEGELEREKGKGGKERKKKCGGKRELNKLFLICL